MDASTVLAEITGNNADGKGGGVYAGEGGTAAVSVGRNGKLTGNSAANGSAVYVNYGSGSFTDSVSAPPAFSTAFLTESVSFDGALPTWTVQAAVAPL